MVDTADETAVQNAERIGQCEKPLVIAFLLGDGGQDVKERIASAVDCFVDLRKVRLEQYKKWESIGQLTYILVSGIMAPFEEKQCVSMDFEDIQQMFSHGGEIHFGIGQAVFEMPEDDACMVAVREAIGELAAQCDLRTMQRVFLSIECGETVRVSIFDLTVAMEEIVALMDGDWEIYNVSVSSAMQERIRAVLFVTETPVTREVGRLAPSFWT